MFDLFQLHDNGEDIFPESWIGIEGKNLHLIVSTIIKELCAPSQGKNSLYSICKEISSTIGLSINAVWNYLRSKNYILIPVLECLLQIWVDKCKKTEQEYLIMKETILSEIHSLKVNNSSSKPIKAVKNVSEELAYLAGAHAADGMINVHLTFSHYEKKELEEFIRSLENRTHRVFASSIYLDISKKMYNLGISLSSEDAKSFCLLLNDLNIRERKIRVKRDYKWALTDEYKNSVISLQKCVLKLFGIYLPVKKHPACNAYILSIKNKILIRYLHIFLGFPYGKKSRIVKMPSSIENALQSIQLAFFRGVLTFDGSVNFDQTLSLETYSYSLFQSLVQLLRQNAIPFITSKSSRKSFSITKHTDIGEWSFAFTKGTEKWYKLHFFIGTHKGRSVISEHDFLISFSDIFLFRESQIPVEKILYIIKKLSIFDLKTFMISFNEEFSFSINPSRILAYLKLLTLCNVLAKKKEKVFFNRRRGKTGSRGAMSKYAFVFNPQIKEWKVPY